MILHFSHILEPWKLLLVCFLEKNGRDHCLNIYHIKIFPHIMLQNQLLSFSLTLSLELKLPTKYTNTCNVWHSKRKTKKNYIMPKLLQTFSTCFCLFLTLHPHPSFQHTNPLRDFITITQLLSGNKPTVDVIDKLGTKGEEEERVKDTYKRGQWVISEKNK